MTRQACTLAKKAPSPASFSLKQSQENRMRICRCIFVLVAALSLFGRGALARQAPQERQGQIIPCSSDDGEKHYCTADTRHGARLVRQRTRRRATGRVVGLRRRRHLGGQGMRR